MTIGTERADVLATVINHRRPIAAVIAAQTIPAVLIADLGDHTTLILALAPLAEAALFLMACWATIAYLIYLQPAARDVAAAVRRETR